MSLLFVEAFGRLSRDANLDGIVSEDEEDLYSVFNARAEMMGWASAPPVRRPLLWQTHEAELTAYADAGRIGCVQVGLDVGPFLLDWPPPEHVHPPEPAQGRRYSRYELFPWSRSSINPAVPLPALIQCFDDALRRFGLVELSGIQVTGSYLEPRTDSFSHFVSSLNGFNIASKGRPDAVIAFDQEFLGGHAEAELLACLQQRNTGTFEFGPVVAVDECLSIRAGVHTPVRSFTPARSGLGLSVALPEWTASAVGWALAVVIDAAGEFAPDVRGFTVRLSRVE